MHKFKEPSTTPKHDKDLWLTPMSFFTPLNKAFKFDLDPCTLDNNLGLKHFFTPEQNGISKDWSSYRHIYINPPYSDIRTWLNKCFLEIHKIKTQLEYIIILLPASCGTIWFHDYFYDATFMRDRYDNISHRFMKRRLQFNRYIEKERKYKLETATFDTMLGFFIRNKETFYLSYGQLMGDDSFIW